MVGYKITICLFIYIYIYYNDFFYKNIENEYKKYRIENLILIYKRNYFLSIKFFGKKINNEYEKSQSFP